MSAFGNYLVQTFVMLLVIVGLAFVVLWAARRLGVGRPSGNLKLVGRLPLDARRSIYLVQVAEKVLVVGVSEAGLNKLSEFALKDMAAPPAQTSPGESFPAVLARLKRSSQPPTSPGRANPEPPSSHGDSPKP